MTCNCQNDIEAKLLERFKAQAPVAKSHNADLRGYTFVFGEKVVSKGCMQAELSAEHPLKKGGFRPKTERVTIVFTYCPFCGKKYDEAAAKEGAEVPA